MIYFNSRYLSERLDINLAKWKRWVREFLPPDPLGGLQSGYARQFNLKEAFRVYLGGQLIGTLRFSIHETRHLLDELEPVLKAQGFYTLYPKKGISIKEGLWLFVFQLPDGSYDFDFMAPDAITLNPEAESGRMLKLSSIYSRFIEHIAA